MSGASADRLAALHSWHADWRGLRVVVLGLSVTGFSVADTLAELGASVLVVSERADEEYARLLPLIGVSLWTGPLGDADAGTPAAVIAHEPDVVIASPGFAPGHPLIEWVQAQGIALWGDVELAWRVRDKIVDAAGHPAKWVLITGTNGKTTTTQLTSQLLRAGGLRETQYGCPCLTRCATPPDSTRSSSNFRATSSGTSACRPGQTPFRRMRACA